MLGIFIVVFLFIMMNGFFYIGWWEFIVFGFLFIIWLLCKGFLLYIFSYFFWVLFYVFIFFFNYIWLLFGLFFFDIFFIIGYKFWFMVVDFVFFEMLVLCWVILFVNIFYNDVFRLYGILNNECIYCKIKRVEIFLFFMYFK